MQRVLTDLESKHNTEQGVPVIGVVQLTGLVHTEDVVAFKEIARQLCKYESAHYIECASYAMTCATKPAMKL